MFLGLICWEWSSHFVKDDKLRLLPNCNTFPWICMSVYITECQQYVYDNSVIDITYQLVCAKRKLIDEYQVFHRPRWHRQWPSWHKGNLSEWLSHSISKWLIHWEWSVSCMINSSVFWMYYYFEEVLPCNCFGIGTTSLDCGLKLRTFWEQCEHRLPKTKQEQIG